MQPEVATFIHTCGGFRASVHVAMSFSRACWEIFSAQRPDGRKRDIYRLSIQVEELQKHFALIYEGDLVEERFRDILAHVLKLKVGWDNGEDGLALRHAVVDPLYLLRLTLRGARPDHEIKYSVMRNIREFYGCFQSSAIAHYFRVLSEAINQLIAERLASPGKAAKIVTWSLQGEVLPKFSSFVYQGAAVLPGRIYDLFLECCRAVNYISLSRKVGFVEFLTLNADGEYLMSRLFGMPTGIKGLDDLFGGGGIMLVDAADAPIRERLGGRAVVTVGPFGSAKSLLSLQMAVEVARKGGVAWVMPLEQTAEDCLYTLESMGCLGSDMPFRVGTTVTKALEILEEPVLDQGALILLRTVKESFDDFLAAFKENVRLMSLYPLRLIIVDPVSALAQSPDSPTEKRAQTLQLFESVKHSGTNIWLVTEDGLPSSQSYYEQNTADTVIRLSSENRHGYSQRYIEITKSRLQREQRGKHALAIVPGAGITVYPSPAAVRSRIRMRSERAPESPINFGLPSLDAILGENGLYAGDVIVLQGPDGCSKTPVGLSFLLESDWTKSDQAKDKRPQAQHRPLLISARDDKATMRHALEHLIRAQKQPNLGAVKGVEDIQVIAIGGGYVNPGYILQQIEDEFLRSRLEERPIGRVMIDNIGHWDLSCPYIREEETFADTLIDLLRRHRVTTVVTCAQTSHYLSSPLQQSLLDHANCLIQFEKVAFRGTSREMVKVIKTRDMVHHRESFELVFDPNTLQITTASSLLQIGSGNKVTPVEVRLFLHTETTAQSAYNRSILETVRSILTREAHLQSQTFVSSSRALALGSASAIDELQILQLDEFQLPVLNGKTVGDGVLQMLPKSAWREGEWDQVISRLRERVQVGNNFTAFPFYQNVGLLTYRKGLSRQCLGSWELLSLECARWEKDHPELKDVFFDFPMVSSENYCVIFLEILLWLAGPPDKTGEKYQLGCVLTEWLTSSDAIQANLIMHRLCQRALNFRHEEGVKDLEQPTPFRVNPNARVWRHWYSTVNQMLSEMLPAERAEIAVAALPGKISVAGEWFLAIPRYSASPDVGLKIIQLYTSPEAELDRLKYGVGLPVRSNFYRSEGNSLANVSPFFSMDGKTLLEVIEHAFIRSSFGCYRNHASMLSTHLQNVLGLPRLGEGELQKEIREQVDQLKNRLMVDQNASCGSFSVTRNGR